jgi:tetratricopeptide (TPR) repeat protein
MFQKSINLHMAFPPNPLDQDPNKLPLLAYTQLGHCQRQQDKLPQAIVSYTKVLEYDPSSGEIAGLLGRLYYLQGNNTLALEYLGYAIEVATEDVLKARPESIADLYLQRVKVYESLNMNEHARAD